MHCPAAVSQPEGVHDTHDAPLLPCPHWFADCDARGMHWPLTGSQQPAQFDAEHAGGGAAAHRWLEQKGVDPEQTAQKLPPAPQAEALVPTTHAPVPRSMHPAHG